MAVLRFDCGLMTLTTLLLLMVSGASAQTTSNCTTAANSLTPCLTYVAGTDASPSQLCCSAITLLNTNDPTCLCQVVVQLGSSSTVNVTKVDALPAACGVTVDTATCSAASPGSSPAPSPASSPASPPGVLASPPPPPALASPPPPPGNDAAGSRPSGAVVVAVLLALGVLALSQTFCMDGLTW